jgi:tetratricopeptide (TPR) repeat protein
MKFGDIFAIRRDHEQAMSEYRAGLAVCETAVDKFPDSVVALRNRGKAHFRLAEALRQDNNLDEAESEYRLAEKDQLAIVVGAPNDATVKSNLASTYNHWAMLARSKREPELALSKLKQGIAMQEALIQSDPNNPQWLAFAAPNYDSAAKILADLNRPNEAFRYLQKALDARRDLAIRDPNNAARQMSFAASAKAVGDSSTSVAQIEAYRDAIRAWKRIAGFAKPPASLKMQADSAVAMARAFADAKDWRDAQSAYWLAKHLFEMNLVDEPTNAVWRDKADAAKKAAQDAAAAALSATDDAAAN